MNTQDCIEKGLDEAVKYNEEVGNTMTSDQEYWFMMGNVKAVDKMVDKACDAFCATTCKGYQDTKGRCFCDGGCEKYRAFRKAMEE